LSKVPNLKNTLNQAWDYSMSQKADYYEVLGISKAATASEIQTAYKKIVMACHEDTVRNRERKAGKSDDAIKAEVEKARKKLIAATEAKEVLTDDKKRAAYDSGGHSALENLGSGPGVSFKDLAGPTQTRRSTEDDFSFFDKIAERRPDLAKPSDGLTAAERRERAKEERLRAREALRSGGGGTSTEEPKRQTQSTATEKFTKAAEDIRAATGQLKNSEAIVDVAVLERFMEGLDELRAEVSNAIKRSKSGPKP
jgi:DnaJ-class molecular chaperone